MLNDFKEDQNVACKIIENEIKHKKINHAYLIETNGYSKSLEFAKAMAKSFLCPNSLKHTKEEHDECHICSNIDKEIFTELVIIEPDGLQIKKTQTDNLQKEFLSKAVESEMRVYIIKEANKLNEHASNSLLKFIEEPENNIIAILLAENSYNVIDTIKSRCQIISLKKEKLELKFKIININGMNEEEFDEKITIIKEFVKYLEKNKYDTLLNKINLWTFNDRETSIFAFDIIIDLYIDCLNMKLNKKLEFFKSEDIISVINVELQTVEDIINKIKLANIAKNDIISNNNLDLVLDKYIIDFSGGVE